MKFFAYLNVPPLKYVSKICNNNTGNYYLNKTPLVIHKLTHKKMHFTGAVQFLLNTLFYFCCYGAV